MRLSTLVSSNAIAEHCAAAVNMGLDYFAVAKVEGRPLMAKVTFGTEEPDLIKRLALAGFSQEAS